MVGKRLALDTLVAIGASLVLAGSAVQLAPAVGHWALGRTGVTQIVLTSPTDLQFYPVAVPFFLPPIFAWLAGLIIRLRHRVVPSVRHLAITAAAVTAATAIGIAVQAYEVSGVFARDLGGDLQPMVSPGSLELGGAGWRWCVIAGLVGCVVALRRQASKTP